MIKNWAWGQKKTGAANSVKETAHLKDKNSSNGTDRWSFGSYLFKLLNAPSGAWIGLVFEKRDHLRHAHGQIWPAPEGGHVYRKEL